MKIALVYDRVTKWGGAERVLLALHEIWPDAPLYTAVYDKKRAGWADVFTVRTTFLQHIPFAKYIHELLPWITPLAFESLSFDEYDIVISITSAEAKSIITKSHTLHICYCLTPTRYLWSGYEQYIRDPGLGVLSGLASWGLRWLAPSLRRWDLISASRPDYYVAISQRVKTRIQTYYKRRVEAVIYPPVDTRRFLDPLPVSEKLYGEYFLTVSRLVGYKRIDVLIEACNYTGKTLVIIGDGYQKNKLKKMAKHTIHFIDHHLTDSELVRYYQGCRAFLYAADEDFGIAAVEAQVCGKPVIAYKESGIAESIVSGKTGILYGKQHVDAVVDALEQFEMQQFDTNVIQKRAMLFDKDIFGVTIKRLVEKLYLKNHL